MGPLHLRFGSKRCCFFHPAVERGQASKATVSGAFLVSKLLLKFQLVSGLKLGPEVCVAVIYHSLNRILTSVSIRCILVKVWI